MLAVVPQISIAIRAAVAGDLAFVDRLHEMHCKAVGWMPTKQIAQKIEMGQVLIAEDEMRLPVGYCMSTDRYFKRDDVGIVYQMNVAPGQQRKLIGASLLKAVFERAAYGCKLFCCWCAQDLEANYFWESMGFLPLAFRAGRVGKKVRTHIFWQRRIREGDTTTPYWFPAKTDGGALREDRIVLPIPPGVHWRDEMPVLLPAASVPQATRALPEPSRKRRPVAGPARVVNHGLYFAPPREQAKPEKKKRAKVKADPKLIAKARELRDRYLEQFNSGLVLPGGKYEVSRAIEATPGPAPLMLEQAA